ncbi:MAG: hypothetical protein AAF806_12435 [Bacteroidota bacterium]
MENNMQELKELIKEEAGKLICESHPNVCELRDQNYDQMQEQALRFIFQDEEAVSVQTALARMEQEMGDAQVNDVE